ncbi:Os03g0720500, partial [Oryza sativa Japonica Group]
QSKLTTFSWRYDTEAMYFDEDVRTAKRQQLECEILMTHMSCFQENVRTPASCGSQQIQKRSRPIIKERRGICSISSLLCAVINGEIKC